MDSHFLPFPVAEALFGCMFSGKTGELSRRLRLHAVAGRTVVVFRPQVDIRHPGDGVLYAHDGAGHFDSSKYPGKVLVVDPQADLVKLAEAEHAQVVGIDEMQFFKDNLCDDIVKLHYQGITVIAAGLDYDFLGKPFETTMRVITSAVVMPYKLTAICVECTSAPAVYTQKREMGDMSQRIEIGDQKLYKPLCTTCFRKARG